MQNAVVQGGKASCKLQLTLSSASADVPTWIVRAKAEDRKRRKVRANIHTSV